jgi:hypothetical protein
MWQLLILGIAQFHVDSFIYDGSKLTFTYQIGRSNYVCSSSTLSSIDGAKLQINMKAKCPADRIFYSGMQK